MRRVLYVTTINKTINAFLTPHIKYLINKGNVVDVACNIESDCDKELIKLGVKYYNIKFSRNPFKYSNVKAINQIRKLQNKNEYDIVHVHTPIASFITRYALRNTKVKLIYTCHGFHFYKGAPLINWLIYYNLEKISAKWTDKIVTINTEDFKRAKTFQLRNNGKVHIMNGVGIKKEDYEIKNFSKHEYRKKLGVNRDDFMILILAEINKNKNHIQIIKALESIEDKSKIKVICAGEGPMKSKLSKYIEIKKLDNNVKFIGFREDVRELINSCDCIALFSKREGLGKCILEGMTVGKPVIATKTRGPKELIKNNKNGYLVNINDFENTAKLIYKLSINKDIREEFSNESLHLIDKYYLDKVLKDVLKYNLE